MTELAARDFASGGERPGDTASAVRRTGPLRVGAFKTDTRHRDAVERAQAWTRTRFNLQEEASVLVSELECKRPDCPPLETVIAFWTDDGNRYHFKIFKPVAEVRFDDLPPAWLMDALFGTDDDGMGCC